MDQSEPDLDHIVPHQPTPKDYLEDSSQFTFECPFAQMAIWEWFENRKSFPNKTFPLFQTQVEETDPSREHHPPLSSLFGPLIQLSGQDSEHVPMSYRAFRFFYGSFIVSFRFFRPISFSVTLTPITLETTKLEFSLTCLVKRKYTFFWLKLRPYLWKFLRHWIEADLKKQFPPGREIEPISEQTVTHYQPKK